MKENNDIFSIKLDKNFIYKVDNSIFPENCKLADVTPAHMIDDQMTKSNYRPVSLLPAISKKQCLRDYFLTN